ncbi:acyltransferase [Mesorhizobium sp.]|uniref:acyltransferase n=1 Tax=Mesorhizobium sp. TaxID=1871066 RepID=UPI000A07C145|nr:acyltransferase [Mesorhizobium sp.]RWD52505.1 MAG: acyltransferase [Mesorhizobium sp.]RWE57553.1 MAG: acyltransferase [Mesorhizobium sp.]RWF08118.1 MAG: acyltransferase [Mesorhizobium sp.]RWF22076.1 MAG: acyltransferase [Mesorhizobium sp.]TIS63191.1 MAG: acyltransferase [Mesorhizobium sp.]
MSVFKLLDRSERLFWNALAALQFAVRRRKMPRGLSVLGPVGLGGAGVLEIGDSVTIVSKSRFNRAGINHPTQLVVGASGKLSIGDNVGISGASIFCVENIAIGNNVLVGVNCNIFDTDFHAVDYLDRRHGRGTLSAPIVIEDDVWLCANVTVLKGVRIGARSVIAAGSVVTSDIPPNCLAGGVPCKVIRSLAPAHAASIE